MINPVYLGVSSLFDALKDNGLYNDKTENDHRKEFQVPKPLLSTLGDEIKIGKYDEIFRPVFENWIQEIERSINTMRKELSFANDTKILISGSAGYIMYLSDLIQTTTGIKTSNLNPLRNLNLTPDFDKNSLKFNPTILSASIGSGIAIDNAPSILPKQLKQDVIFRWMNRAGLFASVILTFFFAYFYPYKKKY